MEGLKPLFQQVSQRLWLVITLAFFFVSGLIILLFSQYQQVKYIEQTVFPQLSKQSAEQSDAYRAQALLVRVGVIK